MKVSVYLKKSDSSTSNICFRVREKNVDIKVVSPLAVYDKYWDSDTLSYKRTAAVPATEQKRLPRQIAAIIEHVEKTFSDKADSKWLKQAIEDVLYPARAFERNHPNLLRRIHEYLVKFDGADRTKEHIIRFERKMSRYHDYQREILGNTDFMLFVETVTLEQMNDFRDYVVNEHLLQQEHPGFYASRLLVKRKPKPLSGTTVINIMNLFCTFLHWCKKMKYSDNEVYALYGCKEPTYGDPFYLTSEERNILYNADLSDCPKLSIIRDIFVFHCYVGCRVGDLYRLTRDNIKDGFLEYMPQKTKKCQAKTVRVPLHEKALKILEHYDKNADRLLPFKTVHTYNLSIRELLKHCGIDRMVTILDTHGYNTVQRPLYEVASSHTARKTFVGNLYKQVPDPNLIASLSGHVEGSRAFRRYRTIDDDMKRKMVALINYGGHIYESAGTHQKNIGQEQRDESGTCLFPCPGHRRSGHQGGKRAFHQPQPLERGETGLQAPCGIGLGGKADELRPGHPADYAPYHQGIPPRCGRQLAQGADRGIPPSQHQREGRQQGRRIPAVVPD